jgi:hypothetical protein
MSKEDFELVREKALALFAFGQVSVPSLFLHLFFV